MITKLRLGHCALNYGLQWLESLQMSDAYVEKWSL